MLDAGRYLVSDHPARKSDYAGFKPPRSSKKAAPKKPRKEPEATAPIAAPAKSPPTPENR